MEQRLQQIADMLVLNGMLTDCPGLIHGKTGIAVFFFRYARYTNNKLFENYAVDLIGEIQSQIHNNSPADYEQGIAGIGVGIDFLVQNNFLKPAGDLFEDFDKRMYRAVMYDPWQDFSKYDGLSGYGRYWLMRLLQSPSNQARECLLSIVGRIEGKLPDIAVKEQSDVYCFLHDLQKISGFDICIGLLEQCREWNISSADTSRCFPRLGVSAVGNIVRLYQYDHYFNGYISNETNVALKQTPDLDMEKAPVSMGLLTGYAGEAMLRLTAIRSIDTSWMKLL
jgi:hypothetical protein